MQQQQTPSIAIKTAKELIAANKRDLALQTLSESLAAKKNKSWQPEMEELITLLLDVCIKTSNAKTAKDALYQYRQVSQNNLVSLEKVIQEFLVKVDNLVKETNESASREISKLYSEEESPESLILRAISGEDLADRTRKLHVATNQKFLLECYRGVLELVRNKQQHENLYHNTAVLLMNFCVNNEKKPEFRRIGELLRGHWVQLVTSPTPNAIAAVLPNQQSLNTLFSVRFDYLNLAIKLELWQEAFKTVEDISEISNVLKRQPPPHMLANYYESLAQLFWVSHNYVFHAYARLRHYVLSKNQNRSLSETDLQRIASLVLISALSVPLESPQFSDEYFEYNMQKEKNTRLTALLGLNSSLRRDNLMKEIAAQGIPLRAIPELRNAFHLVEEKFHPLDLCKSLEPVYHFIQNQPALTRYTKLFKKASFTRQLQQLAKVYKTMNLEQVYSLSPISTPDRVEKLIVKSAKLGLISARLDHPNQKVSFATNALESGTIKNQLCVIYEKLSAAVSLIQPGNETTRLAQKEKLFKEIPALAEKENEANMDRLQQIEDEKEREETIEKLKERLETLKAQLQAAKKNLEPAPAPVVPVEEPKEVPVPVVDETIKKEQDARIQREKTLKERLISLTYKMDYLERARREVESPLLKEWFETAAKEDKEFHEKETKEFLQKHREDYERELVEKHRLAKIMEEKEKYEDAIREEYAQQLAVCNAHNEEIQRAIKEEKDRLREELLKQRKEREELRIQKEREDAELREKREVQLRQEREEEARRKEKEREERPKNPWGHKDSTTTTPSQSVWGHSRDSTEPSSRPRRTEGESRPYREPDSGPWGRRSDAPSSGREDRWGSRRPEGGDSRPSREEGSSAWGRSRDSTEPSSRPRRTEGESRPYREPDSGPWGRRTESGDSRPSREEGSSSWGSRRSDAPSSSGRDDKWGSRRSEGGDSRPSREEGSSTWGSRRSEGGDSRPSREEGSSTWGSRRSDAPSSSSGREDRGSSSWGSRRSEGGDSRPSREEGSSSWGSRRSDAPSSSGREDRGSSTWGSRRSEGGDSRPSREEGSSTWGRKRTDDESSSGGRPRRTDSPWGNSSEPRSRQEPSNKADAVTSWRTKKETSDAKPQVDAPQKDAPQEDSDFILVKKKGKR